MRYKENLLTVREVKTGTGSLKGGEICVLAYIKLNQQHDLFGPTLGRVEQLDENRCLISVSADRHFGEIWGKHLLDKAKILDYV